MTEVSAMESASMPNTVRQRRGLPGMPKSRMQANAAPPVVYHGVLGRIGSDDVAMMLAGVVVIVSVAVAMPLAEMDSGLVEPKLTVGGF